MVERESPPRTSPSRRARYQRTRRRSWTSALPDGRARDHARGGGRREREALRAAPRASTRPIASLRLRLASGAARRARAGASRGEANAAALAAESAEKRRARGERPRRARRARRAAGRVRGDARGAAELREKEGFDERARRARDGDARISARRSRAWRSSDEGGPGEQDPRDEARDEAHHGPAARGPPPSARSRGSRTSRCWRELRAAVDAPALAAPQTRAGRLRGGRARGSDARPRTACLREEKDIAMYNRTQANELQEDRRKGCARNTRRRASSARWSSRSAEATSAADRMRGEIGTNARFVPGVSAAVLSAATPSAGGAARAVFAAIEPPPRQPRGAPLASMRSSAWPPETRGESKIRSARRWPRGHVEDRFELNGTIDEPTRRRGRAARGCGSAPRPPASTSAPSAVVARGARAAWRDSRRRGEVRTADREEPIACSGRRAA